MEAARKKPEIQTLDDLFGITPSPASQVPEGTDFVEPVVSMPIAKIRDFKNHPYRVLNDHITQKIVDDIRQSGRIDTPAIIRPLPDGGYEMISGHRRKLACNLASLETMPVIIRTMTDDEAVITMVRTNNQREEVLPSEKARAYKMWMEALNRQGERTDLTFSPLGKKLYAHEQIAEETGESKTQIYRYVDLNNLIPEILQMVDDDFVKAKDKPTVAFRVGVEIASLSEENQRNLLETMESEGRTPSVSQAQTMKKLSDKDKEKAKNTANGDIKAELNMDKIFEIMQEEKPNQVDKLKIPYDRIRPFIPPDFTAKKTEELILKLLEGWYIKRERERDMER